MADAAAPQSFVKPGRFRLRSKITFPYAVLAVCVGIVAAFLLTQVVVGNLEERFANQLLEAGGQAADSVVRIEQQNLETLRLVTFTEGLAEAVESRDRGALASIAGLAALNACQDTVDVLDSTGQPVFAAHRHRQAGNCQAYSFEPWTAEYESWKIVQTVSAGSQDEQGDKYADLIRADETWLLYTAGPIFSLEGEQVGTLLVGTYLDSLVRKLKEDALADVTTYAADGQPLASTFPAADAKVSISPDQYRQALDEQGETIFRSDLAVAGDLYQQVLISLEIRGGRDLGVLGVALRTDWIHSAAYPARNGLIAIFGLAIVAILLMGNVISGQIVRPIYELVTASREVAQGNLSRQVSVDSRDEIGVLSQIFNRMVIDLRERERVKNLFGRYVGDEIAKEILKGNMEIGGRRAYATVLFSDIRDFTAFSEQSDPTQLIESLQEYFTAMISEVEAQRGIINKFGGDSILALFGAPVTRSDHATLAVKAALRMSDRLVELNRRRVDRGDPPMRIGIGVNSGDMMVGNIGTSDRAEFTAIGDAVNVASRLSDMNKQTPIASIFISQSTFRRLGSLADELVVESLGDIQMKGRTDAVTVYAVMGMVGEHGLL